MQQSDKYPNPKCSVMIFLARVNFKVAFCMILDLYTAAVYMLHACTTIFFLKKVVLYNADHCKHN